jgi:D-alanyl-D-alanine carboxypeptidase
MSKTTFRNPHGLPDSAQVTTAHDLVRLAQSLQDRFPKYYSYFGKKSFTYRGARHRNHNRLLGSVAGVDGIKTGYTRASGFNLVTNVERDGRHIIAVVLGGKSASRRDAHMRDLIAKYMPKASRGGRTTPPVTADDAEPDVTLADSRIPRSRPELEADEPALAYAPTDGPRDVVSAAMAEAENSEGDVGEAPEADPIAERIEMAGMVAEFADIALVGAEGDPIGRLTEIVRIRAGVEDVVAAAPLPESAGGLEATDHAGNGSGWYIQIGAVPTKEGADALIEKAQSRMGQVLASAHPVMQEIDHRGSTLYRARFAGFADKEEARAACAKLKRKAFSCLAVPN